MGGREKEEKSVQARTAPRRETRAGGGGYRRYTCIFIAGSQDIAVDEEILEKYNVTHVLNVATFVKNTFPDKCIYKNIDIMDIPKTGHHPLFRGIF